MHRDRAIRLALPSIAAAAVVACASGSNHTGFLPPGEEVAFGPDAGTSAFSPNLGSTVTAEKPPPPISGGTLLVTKSGAYAVAADSDRDAVYIVNLSTKSVQTVTLVPGDEPGRLAEDAAGFVYVALRGSASIATIDPARGTLNGRQSVCPAPRGVAWDETAQVVWVACATGELVGLPSGGGTATKSYVVERDLRDVLVSDGALSVTQFRSANVLRLTSDGKVNRRDLLPSASVEGGFASQVLWRAVSGAGGVIATVHEEESHSLVQTTVQGGYGGGGGGCGFGGSSSGAFGGPPPPPPPPFPGVFDGGFGAFVGDDGAASNGSLLVADGGAQGGPAEGGPAEAGAFSDGDGGDAGSPQSATSEDAGNLPVQTFSACVGPDAGPVTIRAPSSPCLDSSIVHSAVTVIDSDGAVKFSATFPGAVPVDIALSPDGFHVATVAPGNAFQPQLSTLFVVDTCSQTTDFTGNLGDGQPVAVAIDASNRILVQTREPASLWTLDTSGRVLSALTLSTVSRKDTGHDIFHVQAGGMIACASCHPEGGDDGHVWNLDGSSRRTPSLRGTIAGTAPYHWPGDMKDLPMLFDDVYTRRMSGAKLANDQVSVLKRWVEAVPAPPAPSWVDSAAAARGKAVFERGSVGCASCHSGAKLTNNQTVNVGTGGQFQVPPLVGLGWRAPFLHDGCAASIADRFVSTCATSAHGNTSSLSSGEVSDLVAYLETL